MLRCLCPCNSCFCMQMNSPFSWPIVWNSLIHRLYHQSVSDGWGHLKHWCFSSSLERMAISMRLIYKRFQWLHLLDSFTIILNWNIQMWNVFCWHKHLERRNCERFASAVKWDSDTANNDAILLECFNHILTIMYFRRGRQNPQQTHICRHSVTHTDVKLLFL